MWRSAQGLQKLSSSICPSSASSSSSRRVFKSGIAAVPSISRASLSTSLHNHRDIPGFNHDRIVCHDVFSRSFAAGAPKRKAIMTVTPTAAARLEEIGKLDPDCIGIKVGLRKRGCNGMSYVMDFQKKDDPISALDERIKVSDTAEVFVDSQAVLFLVGTEMDYVEVEMGSEFVFRNPNEKSTCGCGQSFNV